MGEIAEAMLDGTMCCQCGDYLGGDQGFPVLCAGCRRAERRDPRLPPRKAPVFAKREPRADQVACPTCGKIVKKVGLPHHILDKHPEVRT